MMKKNYLFWLLALLFSVSNYAQQPVGIGGNWTLQPDFSDEFNNGLNTNKWDHNPNDWGPWSWETRHTKVNNGKLKLTLDWDRHTRGGKQLYFTSGIIRSKKNIKYGYFEIRMKGAPRHPGVCPAFWTYSIGQTVKVINGQRVKYNEIDFPEIQQRKRNVKLIDWNLIRADDARPQKRTSVRETTGGGQGPSFDPRNAYHVYGCLWESGSVKFYIDGRLVATANASEAALQQHQQRLVISLGLREPFYEYRNGSRHAVVTNSRPSGFPTTMQVDYVRTWKRAGGGNGGGGTACAPAWKSGATYALKDEVSHNGKKWRWKSRTNGNCTPGACGRWKNLGACSSSNKTVTQKTSSGSEFSNYIGNGDLNAREVSQDIGFGPSGLLNIYPNPAKNELYIDSDGMSSISIYDIRGVRILNKQFQDRTTVNVRNFAKGLYLVKVANEVTETSKKVVVD
ncbi:family 16 glycosylhydrolase [Flavivirga abyssicola]|uniref:family 16 glycosylhydrolase n=1 Tax=Flavivirga abyssicola TaxID=3063533 RepID=UPI0026E06912|nr:family 16 glycosylhydrolase [Flavivirga sp. MEBiC07777]WVK12520.1 family 16 glycosylhydrolase [Flavivirga sp. MEBiC07777]